MSQPTFPTFINFLAATRKPMLIPFGLFSPNQDTSWIASVAAGGANLTPVNLTPAPDGANAIFTVPTTIIGGVAIYRNGVLQDPLLSYSIVGQSVTFNASNIPAPFDDLQALVS